MIQCYHYMAVTGKKNWYIAVVILGQEFKYAKISWDEEMIQNLITVEEKLLEEPYPDGESAAAKLDLKQMISSFLQKIPGIQHSRGASAEPVLMRSCAGEQRSRRRLRIWSRNRGRSIRRSNSTWEIMRPL